MRYDLSFKYFADNRAMFIYSNIFKLQGIYFPYNWIRMLAIDHRMKQFLNVLI